ncbi:MAG TPA: hypothetical protein DCZ91_09820 [Lachnospiraceae bacterium]|nr:hypothetical protein [Lachnospiraceae bacterium]
METLKKQAAKLLGEQKKYRRWLAVFLCLAILVTAGTTAALKMNGQALSHEKKVLACSEEVHVHTEKCYESGVIPAQADGEGSIDREQPICGYADYVVHTHDAGCYDEDGELVCELPEIKAHVHDESCFEKQMVLVCGKEETPAHQHTADCRELICGQEESLPHQHTEDCRELICGKEETEGHQHTDACRTITQGELICENTEEGHEHTEECYEQIESITCGMEETEGHTHTEECYGPYICGYEGEEEEHIHTEECYGPYTCGYGEETEGHVHTEDCYQVKEVAVCGELELHTHIREASEGQASCYDAEGNLICGIPELREHQHGEECFEIIEVKDDEDGKLYQKVYEDADVRVTAEYMADAHIPEEAELVAERIEVEPDSEGAGETAGTESEESSDVQESAGTESVESSDAQESTGTESAESSDAQELSGTESEGIETEIIEEKVSYRLKFLVDGTEIEPEGTVSFIVQGLDGEGNNAGELVTLVYKAGDGVETMAVTLKVTKEITRETGAGNESEEAQLIRKVYEDTEVRVTAEYGKDANIPEAAQLVAQRLDTDDDQAPVNADSEAGVQTSQEAGGEADAQAIHEVSSETDTQASGEADGETGAEATKESGNVTDTQDSKVSADETEAQVSQEAGSEADAQEASVTLETVEKEVSYRLMFLADGAEIEPEGDVKFTVQGLDGEGNDVGEAVAVEYHAGDSLDTLTVSLTRTVTIEVQHAFHKEAQDGDLRVIVKYDSDAEIPEGAVLRVSRITAEDETSYAELEAGYQEQAGEGAAMDLGFAAGFYMGEEPVEVQAPVTIEVQMAGSGYEAGDKLNVFSLEENGAEKLDASPVTVKEDGSIAVSFKSNRLSAYMIGAAVTGFRKECRNDELNITVIAEYGPEAELPKEAELKVEAITPETDPEHYAQREAEYLEMAGEGATMDMLLNIGFYVDGVEVEPKAPVSITIQMADGQYEDGEQMNVIHFGDEGTEKLTASDIETDEEGNKTTGFETNGFSNYALGRAAGAVTTLESGKSYQIYCESSNGKYALYHNENHVVSAVPVTVNTQGTIEVQEGYKEEGFTWIYESNSYGTSLKSEDGWCLADIGHGWTMMESFTMLQFGKKDSDSSDSFGISSTVTSNYLTYTNGQIGSTSEGDYTAWKFVVKSERKSYKINYYQNEESVSAVNKLQDEPEGKGELIGTKEVYSEERNGKEVICIPLTGSVTKTSEDGSQVSTDIGNLGTLTGTGIGIDCEFYGWSLMRNSNFLADTNHLIYCGDPSVIFNGMRAPTFVEEGVLTVDVEDDLIKRMLENNGGIDLYAIWAVPSGAGGLTYAGTGNGSLDKNTFPGDTNRKNKGVVFFIRLDGTVIEEPNKNTSEYDPEKYTQLLVFARDENGNKIQNPLNYWMYIYGKKEAEIIANLRYKPQNEDLLAALKDSTANNKTIKVAGETVTFPNNMTLEDFEANYYVSWYVCKDGTPQQNDCWHIDGVVLKKEGIWNLSYDANGGDTSTIISTKQYKFKDTNDGENETATVHNSLRTFENASAAQETDIHPDRVGYKFIGWNTKPDGTGVSFTAGEYFSETGTEAEDFNDNDTITVDAEGNVFQKNGEQVPNLKATRNSNGVYEVKLYAQWGNGTNRLIVKKTGMDKTTALPGAEFKLSECTKGDNGVLVESKNLTGSNGSAVNENGILTIQNLENNTYYCLEEIVPPNGYELRTEKIYFSVLVDEANQAGEVVDLFILNEKGEKIDRPQWLQKSYSGGGSQGSGGLATIQFVFADKAIYQEVVFKKTKEDGQTSLGGAQFQLYKGTKGADEQISYEQVPLDTSTLSAGVESEESGVFKFSNLKDDEGKKTQSLPYGYYKLVETTTPTGYKPTTVYFEINDPDTLPNNGMVVTGVEVDGEAVTDLDQSKYSVESEGTTTTVEGVKITRYKYTLSVANLPSTKTVALRKVGSGETTGLSGAEFELYRDDKLTDKVNTELIQTNENGIALIGELDCGEYWLKETKAPDGYNLPTGPIKIIVETGKVTAMNGTVPDVQDKEDTISEGKTGYILTIYNSKGIVLPETGGSGTTMFTLGGVAVIAASLMYGLSMRRKKRKGGYY